jgi:hypothetical protein
MSSNYSPVSNTTLSYSSYTNPINSQIILNATQSNLGNKNEGFVGNLTAAGYDLNRDNINKYQIQPLNAMADENYNSLYAVSSNATDISNNINLITNTDETGLRDVMTDNDKYHFKGNVLNILNNSKPTLVDALNEDTNSMVLNETNVYILGTITVATLLITAIYISK